MRGALAIAIALGTAVAVACTSKEPVPETSGTPPTAGGTPVRKSTAPCSNGPARTAETQLAYGGDDADHPSCTPRCAYERDPSFAFDLPEALPSGACISEGEVCSMAIEIPCCGHRGFGGPVHGMRCACERGEWTCTIASQGAAVCSPCVVDASAGD